jgi:hypothetical protein
MTTHSAPTYHHGRRETDSGAFFKVATVLLGILVAVLGFFALLLWADAKNADDATDVAVAALNGAPLSTAHANHNTALPLDSFAGVVPENADELAKAHPAADAVLLRCRRATSSRSR